MSQEPGARILVVDDEPGIIRAVRAYLTRRGFQVESADTGREALASFERRRPDLLLLDLGLSDGDGLEVIRHIRASASTPIIVLSVRGAERDKVAALDLGADDYLTKPFGVDELLARIRVALRHLANPRSGAAPVFHTGDLEVDVQRRRVTVRGQEGTGPMYRRILVVEDEARLRQVITRNLVARGHLVREATTADDAVQAVLEERPDLLLLDINLPDRSGWDVLRELRGRGVRVPTAVVSAVRAVPSRLAEFQPLAYLPKPFPLEALLRLVGDGEVRAEPAPDVSQPVLTEGL